MLPYTTLMWYSHIRRTASLWACFCDEFNIFDYILLVRVLCHPVQHKQEHWITNKNQIKFFYFNVDAGDVIIKSFSARLTKACTCIPSYDVFTGGEMHKYPLRPPFSVTLSCESDLNIRTQITWRNRYPWLR